MNKEIRSIFGKRKVILRGTGRAVTPYGGISVFVDFLNRIGYREAVERYMPIWLRSPNAIRPGETLTAFLISVLVGARRFAQTAILRGDEGLHRLLGLRRYPTDDTIRNLFKRFGQGQVVGLFSGLTEWMLDRVPIREGGYSVDLDSTVFERYGKQEGAKKGHNPRKHGRPSHHPILAILAEANFVLHSWLRSGNSGASRGVVEFMKEGMALLGDKHRIRLVRADSGFLDKDFLVFLERRKLGYIVVARMSKWVKREVVRVGQWRELDEVYAVGEFKVQLLGWDKERRFVVVREKKREEKGSVGRSLFELPEYTFRVFVTNLELSPEEVWREYNQRANMENRIAELKYDLGADDFCMRRFFATEAAFRSVTFLFNLLSEFQRATGMVNYQRAATLRSTVFLCGAILGKAGRRTVLFLSESWGGLKSRKPLFEKLLSYADPTSPKLNLQLMT